MITYEKSDNTNTAGHCLYLGEMVNRETGKKKYFIAGINPFEHPLQRYDTVEEAIEENLNHFRATVFSHLLEDKVLIRPERYCVIDPNELGIDIVFGGDSVNVAHKGRDIRESLPRFIQRKYMKFFDKNANKFVEPYAQKHEEDK